MPRPPVPGPAVSLPPGWFSGDTHVHFQPCFGPPLSASQMFQMQQAEEVNVAHVLLWKPGTTSIAEFNSLTPLVTGREALISTVSSNHILQYDVEISGFSASQFGHATGLNLSSPVFPPYQEHPALALDGFRAQPGAITGYAHARWTPGSSYPRLVEPGLYPFMAPMDLALGKIDYLETLEVSHRGSTNWTNLYYRLLNAGLRVSITGATDLACISSIMGSTRTYADLGTNPLTYGNWTQAIKAGKVSLTDDKRQFLDMDVDGVGIGGEVALATAGTVTVTVRMHTTPGFAVNDTLEILRNGQVVAQQPFSLPSGGSLTGGATIQMADSGWIAARTTKTHTGATYVIVNNAPICRANAAAYFEGYCDYLTAGLSAFKVELFELQVRQHIAQAKRVFQAFSACAGNLPAGVQRYGFSTPACEGPIAIGAQGSASEGSTSFLLTCLGAPPLTNGALLFGAGRSSGLVHCGVTLFLDPNAALGILPLATPSAGYSEVGLQIPVGARGIQVYAQYFWVNPPSCGGGPLSTSDALSITFQ